VEPLNKKVIKNWAADDRPREKVLDKGMPALSDVELLTILIANGTKDKSALDLAKEVFDFAGNDWMQLSRVDPLALVKNIKGIGKAKAITICTALEIGRRRQQATKKERIQLNSFAKVIEFIKPILEDFNTEHSYAIFLNKKNEVIDHSIVAIGGLDSVIMDMRIVFQKALLINATMIIMAHNHPSGNATPSEVDKKITIRMSQAGEILNIKVVDHIIVTHNQCYSFTNDLYL
jgi:DNA repair protein RadC